MRCRTFYIRSQRSAGRRGRELGSFLWRASTKDEVDADIAFHLDMLTRDLMQQGLPHSQARAEAERRFGDVAAVSAESRKLADEREYNERQAEVRGEARQDVGFAMRQLRLEREPNFPNASGERAQSATLPPRPAASLMTLRPN